jgi:type I restriction enzyme S subunit
MRKRWEIKSLKEVCILITDGNWIESKHQANNGIRLIQTGNVGLGEFRNKEGKERYISDVTFNQLGCTEIFPGDILVSRLPDPVGRSCMVPQLNQRMITAVDCTIVRLDQKILISDYFRYYSQSQEYFNNIKENITGTTRDRISRTNLGKIKIPIPSIQEQRRIISLLNVVFASIAKAKANAEQNLKNAKELFENYIDDLFSEKKDFWEVCELSEIATFRNGMNYSKGSKGEVIKIVGVKDFQNNFWVPVENLELVTIDGNLNELDSLNEGDIFAVRSNGSQMLIGRMLLAKNSEEKVSHSGFTIRIRLHTRKILPSYLCHYLRTERVKKELVTRGTGVNIKSLNQSSLSSLQISIPPLSKQENVIKKIEFFMYEYKKLTSVYQQKLNNLEELKKSILQKAFSGELN